MAVPEAAALPVALPAVLAETGEQVGPEAALAAQRAAHCGRRTRSVRCTHPS